MANNAIFARLSGGNVKLGNMASFSKLYGNDSFNTKYGSVTGTCGGHCLGCKQSCYVRKSYRYGSVINGHARNTLAFRTNLAKAFEQINSQMDRKRKPFKTVRINQSGEFETATEMLFWISTASKHPETKFYVYTKAFEILDAIANSDITIPQNFTVLVSIWHEYGIEEFKKFQHLAWIKAFAYMDGFDYESHGIHIETLCHAYDESGKLDHNITCDKCRKCIDSKFKVIGCYDH